MRRRSIASSRKTGEVGNGKFTPTVDLEIARITVADALELPSLAAGAPEVLTHPERLDAPIRWTHVGEISALASVLRGGELVLTTGIGIGSGEAAMERFVADLAERKIAALVFELGTSFDAVPPALIESAERNSLLLIALHRGVSFVEVTEMLNDALHRSEIGLARRADRLREQLIALMIDGRGAPDILDAVAAEIENPLVLEREDGSLLFHATFAADSGEVIVGWDALKSHFSNVPPAMTVPIPTATGVGGLLHALAIDRPFDDFTNSALRCAADLIGVATRQSQQEQALAARERGNLLMELVDSELTEKEISRRVGAMGFPPRVGHLLPCIFRSDLIADESVLAAVWNGVRRELSADTIPAIGGLTSDGLRVLMMVGLAKPSQRDRRADSLARLLARESKRATGADGGGCLVVGAASRSWTGAVEMLRELVEVADQPGSDGKLWYDATRPDLDRLLWGLRRTPELRRFVDRTLRPLLEHDATRNTTLLPTLEAFLQCGGHKTETARALYIERQSVYHRLSRIEGLLGASLDDEATRLGLHLAIRARYLTTDREPQPEGDA